MVLLSPVGITIAEDDYKSTSSSCCDCLYGFMVNVGWALKLNYKSILGKCCCCFKEKIIKNFVKGIELQEKEKEIFTNIIMTLISLPEGSDSLFYDFFRPRVIPKIALEPLITEEPKVGVSIVYGGEIDWVDKKGAQSLSLKFPEKIKFLTL